MIATTKSTELGRVHCRGLSLEKFATTLRADFRFAPLNVLLLVAIFVIGLVVHLIVHAFSVQRGRACVSARPWSWPCCCGSAQVWEAVVVLGTADGLIALS